MKKKKIGILTFHRSINYGAFLQAYSLSNNLRKDTDYDVEIIDYNTKATNNKYLKQIVVKRPLNTKSIYNRAVQYLSFRKALNKLNLSDKTFVSDSFDDLFNYMNDRYDVIIVGSDAVWNWLSRGLPNAYFLNFNFTAPLFSYAASVHGMDFTIAEEAQTTYCTQALKRFSFIGVRDISTENFVKFVSPDSNPVHTCDPTILLDMDSLNIDLEKLKMRLTKKYKIDFGKPIIGLMTSSESIGRFVRDHYSKEFTIVALYVDNKFADVFLYDLSPFEWAKVFSLFKITFTQYFHGTILSLKNLTPIISIDVWKFSSKQTGKMEDILSRLGLSNCYFHFDKLNPDFIENILVLADQMIKSPPKDKIQEAINKEAATYKSFLNEIKKIEVIKC